MINLTSHEIANVSGGSLGDYAVVGGLVGLAVRNTPEAVILGALGGLLIGALAYESMEFSPYDDYYY